MSFEDILFFIIALTTVGSAAVVVLSRSLSSDLQKSGVIRFIHKPKKGQ